MTRIYLAFLDQTPLTAFGAGYTELEAIMHAQTARVRAWALSDTPTHDTLRRWMAPELRVTGMDTEITNPELLERLLAHDVAGPDPVHAQIRSVVLHPRPQADRELRHSEAQRVAARLQTSLARGTPIDLATMELVLRLDTLIRSP